jgi:LysR family transcriptional regulator, transcriptional activator of the cysJI operon
MELEARLRAFAAFARALSFSAAARELHISQPAVSKHIADMEREAGVKLVKRQPRGGVLTPAGEFLANHVLRAQALLAQATRGVGEFRQRVTGSLTIVASGVPATYLLPEVVVAFRRLHPDVRVSIVPGASAQTMDALRSHRAELGVVGGFAAAPEIEAEPLVEEEVVVVGPPELAGRKISRQDAEAATWISPYEGSATRAAVEAAWADAGIVPSHHLELPNWESVKLAVARGHGLAGCSQFTVERELREGSLALVRLRGWKVRRTISIVRHREAVLTPSAREFVAMLHARWGRGAESALTPRRPLGTTPSSPVPPALRRAGRRPRRSGRPRTSAPR